MSATSSFGRSMSDDLRRRCQPDVQCLKRALYLTDGIYGDPRISGGRSDLTVPEQILNDPDIDALLQKSFKIADAFIDRASRRDH